MALTASSLVLALALASGASEPLTPALATSDIAVASSVAVDAAPVVRKPLSQAVAAAVTGTPEWMMDRSGRPAALPAMYVGLAAMHAMDFYSTRRALENGAAEGNPLMRGVAGNSGAMLAVKAASAAASIYLTERTWKKNRKGAVVMMAVVNGVTAAVVARNVSHAR
jgi:hypothetical protein